MSDDSALLSGLLAVRGVLAAAVVGVDGEFLSGEATDKALLDRMVGTVTSALAAGEALAGLLDRPVEAASGTSDEAEEARPREVAPSAGPEAAAQVTAEGDEAGLQWVDEQPSAGVATGGRQHQLMVMYQDGGPILFTPLPGGTRLAVVALSSSHDIGRARFQLRSLAGARVG